ncbi:hypothetical protein VNO78_06697 [Psophocarpus tetragonolobus]|uniref:RING-type domain-containing protein n=1 Tax=Psophocarpus tetragonolobus TaxID=3891 RepID=A0AAN9SVH7_PSOTE
MAVDASNLNLFPPQLIPNRENMINPMDATMMNIYGTQTGNYSMLPLSGTTTTSETFLTAAPPPQYPSLPQKTTVLKSDNSTLTNNNNNNNVVSVPRKRSRDHDNNFHFQSYPHKKTDAFSFLGEDISFHIHRQQLDLHALVSQHMEKMRMELEEKRKKQAKRLIEAIEIEMMKKLKAKEEEISKIEKLNWVLEEKVRSLCIENQIWRDLAQTNEATANALRSNLEQVLAAHVGGVPPGDAEEDVASCCGSGGEGWHTVVAGARVKDDNESERRLLCRKCGKEESSVLILPCRHLCVCTVCGSSVECCPVCKSFKNASVHVNMT